MKTKFQGFLPGVYFLDYTDLASLEAFLVGAGRLDPGETVVSAEKAGEGNMNCTVRVRTSQGNSLIVKQSRPWLEKYPDVAAPFDRTLMEGRYYQLIQDIHDVSSRMPRLLWTDEANRIIAFEDLGPASDFFPLYRREIILDEETLVALVDYLSALHSVPVNGSISRSLRNAEMRALNHEHIFDLPLRVDHGLDADVYTPGLAAVGAKLKHDREYLRVAAELGKRYRYGAGQHILHGDYFPGSFLRTTAGVRVIDPEFCFCGDAEFDLGVFYGHLLLAGEPIERANRMTALYRPTNHPGGEAFQPQRVRQYAGIEIMRRLLGLAQIPTLDVGLECKSELLELSHRLVVAPGADFS